MFAQREFGGLEQDVASARRFVGGVLDAWDVPAADAILLVSELATNAVVHAASSFTIDVRCTDAGVLRIEVHDTDPTPPAPEAALTTEAVRGRGLLLVTSLARQWGYRITGTGKTVWFEL